MHSAGVLLLVMIIPALLVDTSRLTDQLEEWQQNFDQQELVAMSVFGSSRYTVDKAGLDDWRRLLPSRGGHLVKFLDPESPPESNYTTFTVTMLHQLKCLEIYHREYVQETPSPPSPLVKHCLNYLRQQVLCRLNLKLESARNDNAGSTREYETVCRDWDLVYKAVEQNQRQWVKEVQENNLQG
ncbi:hypothetical protein AAF712_015052 [Marasmius tenuissimus]|uniref:Uncharacterized protein n=1 Tax=Marasmius tenuissimus TaxID=585030 RepID=A0ABR2Z9D5_9AGAR